tara:strand:- start:16 stop:816 length:801 start_codon:yes stop_codon:yes gene_type:complete
VKTCALHWPLEFDKTEERPTIYETIDEMQKNDVEDVDELIPEKLNPVTIPYDIANEMVEQYSMLLIRLEERNGNTDDIAEIFVRRATLYSCMGKHDQAYADAKKAVSLRPSYTPASFRAGHAAFKSGKFVEAIQMFQHGLKLSNENIYLNRAYKCAIKAGLKDLKVKDMPEYMGEIKSYNEYIEWQREYQIVKDEIEAEIAAGKEPSKTLPIKPSKFNINGYETLIDTLIKEKQKDEESLQIPEIPEDRVEEVVVEDVKVDDNAGK